MFGRKWQTTFRYFYYHLCTARARRLTTESPVDEIVRFAFDGSWDLLKPIQVREEIAGLLSYIRPMRPAVILEIGTGRSGGTLFMWSRVASEDATLITMDLPGGEFGGSYPARKIPFFKSLPLPHQRLHLIRGNSHDPATLERVKTILGERPVDFLFIDGDHTYEGVKQDVEMYGPLVRTDGVIALQDIVPHPPTTGCDVNRLWNELKTQHTPVEFVKNWQQQWAGIGLIRQPAVHATSV